MIKPLRFARKDVPVLAVLLGLLLPVAAARAADLQEVLDRFDRAQSALRTLSAEFAQTTTNSMLKDPILANGRFFMNKPASIRWEYTIPEAMSFVIDNDRYTGYFPARKRAEKKNGSSFGKRVLRYFGMGQSSKELAKLYDISLGEPEKGSGDNYLLILKPKKRRARKRMDEVRFWLDARSYLPVKVRYTGTDGNTLVFEFTEMVVNPDLAASLFTMEIPADVTVTNGFGGIPGISPVDSQ